MLSALTSYLQQQPLPGSDPGTKEAEAVTAVREAAAPANDSGENPYAPSQRALLVSAVASDFDVRSLSSEESGALQQQLQQYGLVTTTELNAFSLINTARADLAEGETLDAVAILDDARNQFSERGTVYSERQQITRLHTLMHNIASARIA